MKFKIKTIMFLLFSIFLTITLFGQDLSEKQLGTKFKKLKPVLQDQVQRLQSIEVPEIQIDLNVLNESMLELQHSLAQLEQIEIPEIDIELPEIPEIELPDIPEIDIALPEIPEIEIDLPEIDFPEIDLDFSSFDFEIDVESSEFELDFFLLTPIINDLSEDEEIKITAICSLGRQEAERAVPVLIKIIEAETNPALRYEAVRQLRKFSDENAVLETLAKTAQKDGNVEVRKQAIYVLGKSKNPKAAEILSEIAKR